MAEKITALDLGFGVDLVVLAADALEPLADCQVSLDDVGRGSGGCSADHLIDRLAGRLGSHRVFRLVRAASHVPERAQIRVPALTGRLPSPAPSDLPRHAARPPLLLEPPEPVTVVAEVPDGAPFQLHWRRVRRRILRAEGPERIAPEWWRAVALPTPDHPRTRDYYTLEDETGAGYWVYREGLFGREEDEDPRWFLHGLFA